MTKENLLQTLEQAIKENLLIVFVEDLKILYGSEEMEVSLNNNSVQIFIEKSNQIAPEL